MTLLEFFSVIGNLASIAGFLSKQKIVLQKDNLYSISKELLSALPPETFDELFKRLDHDKHLFDLAQDLAIGGNSEESIRGIQQLIITMKSLDENTCLYYFLILLNCIKIQIGEIDQGEKSQVSELKSALIRFTRFTCKKASIPENSIVNATSMEEVFRTVIESTNLSRADRVKLFNAINNVFYAKYAIEPGKETISLHSYDPTATLSLGIEIHNNEEAKKFHEHLLYSRVRDTHIKGATLKMPEVDLLFEPGTNKGDIRVSHHDPNIQSKVMFYINSPSVVKPIAIPLFGKKLPSGLRVHLYELYSKSGSLKVLLDFDDKGLKLSIEIVPSKISYQNTTLTEALFCYHAGRPETHGSISVFEADVERFNIDASAPSIETNEKGDQLALALYEYIRIQNILRTSIGRFEQLTTEDFAYIGKLLKIHDGGELFCNQFEFYIWMSTVEFREFYNECMLNSKQFRVPVPLNEVGKLGNKQIIIRQLIHEVWNAKCIEEFNKIQEILKGPNNMYRLKFITPQDTPCSVKQNLRRNPNITIKNIPPPTPR